MCEAWFTNWYLSGRVSESVCSFWEMLKTQLDFTRVPSKRSNGDMMNAGLTRIFVNVNHCGGSHAQMLYKKNVSDILLRHVLRAGDEEVYFCSFKP